MADFLLGSDVVIWHFRGHAAVVELVLPWRGEAVSGCRRSLEPRFFSECARVTFRFLDSCETLPVVAETADRAGEIYRGFRSQGVTLSLPDTLIGATALLASIPLYTCNPRHYPMPDLDLRAVPI